MYLYEAVSVLNLYEPDANISGNWSLSCLRYAVSRAGVVVLKAPHVRARFALDGIGRTDHQNENSEQKNTHD